MNDDVIALPNGDFRVGKQGEPVRSASQRRILRPGVTVVVPNRNYAAYITAALKSISAQTHREMSLIVGDDCSSDDSAILIERFIGANAGRFRGAVARYSECQRGKNGLLNWLLPTVETEYALILDSDDILSPHCVESLLAALQRQAITDHRIAFAYSDCTLIDPSGRPLARGRSCPFEPGLVEERSYLPDCAVTRTTALQSILPLREDLTKGTKHDKYKRLVRAGYWGTHVPLPLFEYRMHDMNISGIGQRIQAEVRIGATTECILSGYWPVSDEVKHPTANHASGR